MATNERKPVLVTGGAGYIGSHAVLALLDAGWPVAVIDNLSTGFRLAVPEGVPFARAISRTARWSARLIAEQGTRAIMHFAGSVVVPESVADPLEYYLNNTVKSRALIAAAVAGGRARISSSPRPPRPTACPDGVPVAEDARRGRSTPMAGRS